MLEIASPNSRALLSTASLSRALPGPSRNGGTESVTTIESSASSARTCGASPTNRPCDAAA